MSNGLLTEINDYGVLASRPAASAALEGYNYHASDEGITYRCNGSSWDEVGINTTAHAAIDHTGITGVGSGSGGGYDEGTSFPVSPSTNDKYYRTDRNLLYYYDGTRWLTTTLYRTAPMAAETLEGYDGDAVHGFFPLPDPTYGVYLVDWIVASRSSSPHTGSAYCTYYLEWMDSASSSTSIASVNDSAIAVSAYDVTSAAINAVLSASAKAVRFGATETGNPGTHRAWPTLTYRLVG